MKNIFSHTFSILGIIILLVIFFSCEDKVTYTLHLNATLKGTVSFYDDLGNPVADDSALIEIIGDEVVASAYSGEDGKYEITNILTGTYDIRVSKEPYEPEYFKSIEFVGGDIPIRYYSTLRVQPQITFSNLKAEFTDDTNINVTANVFHNYDTQGGLASFGYISICLHKEEDVSIYNYTSYGSVSINFESGTEISREFDISYSYSSGETIYIVAYGSGYRTSLIWDPVENEYYYYGYSEPSEIISIVVP